MLLLLLLDQDYFLMRTGRHGRQFDFCVRIQSVDVVVSEIQ
jgi:hypothetical protein